MKTLLLCTAIASTLTTTVAQDKLTVIVFSDRQCNRDGSSWDYAPGCYLLNGYQSLHVNGAPGLGRKYLTQLARNRSEITDECSCCL